MEKQRNDDDYFGGCCAIRHPKYTYELCMTKIRPMWGCGSIKEPLNIIQAYLEFNFKEAFEINKCKYLSHTCPFKTNGIL